LSAGRWTSVRVKAPRNRVAVVNALFALGAEGIQEVGDDVVTHLRDTHEGTVRAAVTRSEPDVTMEFAPTPDVDWSAAWRERLTAHRTGRLVVTPPWLAGEYASAERIVIDPGMAFGTGDHETTRGVLRLMQQVIRPGDVVADLGAGSAVLAIAAAKLGAARVAAIELDPDAIGNAEANVAANQVADRVTVIEGNALDLLPLMAPVRVVVANIISAVLVDLLPIVRESIASDGVAIVSGILTSERDQMTAALESGGWRIAATDEEGIWWSATAVAA
jgi:ribosomal protein L11 methyltransferase